tara:strand:- start:9416 stop:9919 length:504 start_codon:yes stop_codon:yes gene_type:complete
MVIGMLMCTRERFAESQIVEIGYQIAVALEFCHSRNILHQDMKPMNGKWGGMKREFEHLLTKEVLLRESWNPLTQRDVPDLYVADFGIASQVQTIGTRITGQRGTPGYEAPVSSFRRTMDPHQLSGRGRKFEDRAIMPRSARSQISTRLGVYCIDFARLLSLRFWTI